MKHKLSFFAILLMALALPQSVAYAFSAVAPSGQTLYYKIVNGQARVTYPGISTWAGYTQPTGALVIPSSVTYGGTTYSVTSIGENAFYCCDSLTSVTIPNSVTYIGQEAFYGCDSLTSVTIPNSVTYIGNNAFEYCSGLTTVNFNADSCTYMGSDGNFVFTSCTSLTTLNIGSNVKIIPNYAFANFVGQNFLTGALTIPNSVTRIGNKAFYYSRFTSLTIGNSVTIIGNEAFSGCSSLTGTLSIPNSVTSIGDWAFYGCSGLTTVNFNADSCSYMGYLLADHPVFSWCTSLTTLNIGSNVKRIPAYAFTGCSGLTTVNFNADSCTYMGSYDNPVFPGCTNIATLNIGSNVKRIPAYAFKGCSGLTSVTIPNSVTSIGNGSFSACSGLTSIAVASGNPAYDSRNNCNAIIETATNTLIAGFQNTVIPNTVTSIGDWAFSGCSSLTGTLTIPNSVTSIGDFAFYDCSGLTGTLTIPNSVTSIGNRAFSDCSGLTGTLTIPDSVTSIGIYAFTDCSGLTSLTIGNSVTSIGAYAFSDCRGLTSITIGNSVGKLYYNSFSGCTRITSVTLNARYCTIYNYNSNGGSPISGPVSALFGNNNINITSFTFGDNVRQIPDYLCYGMTGLTSITIPNSVTWIGTKAFYNCTALATVVVGNGVSTLRDNTFANCNHMTNLTLGSGLQTIAPAAFAGCNAVLRMTVCAAVPPTSTNNPFTTFNTGIPVYVPCGSISAYQNAPYWGFFTNYQGNFYSFSATSADPSMGYVNIITQPDCNNHQAYFQANAYNGFHFVRWSDGNTTNPRYLVVNADTELTAEFASNVGIDGAEGNEVHVFSNNGRIYVETATLTDMPAVEVYDMAGRRVAIVSAGGSTPELPAGVYVAKVGTYTVQKVVVVK